MPAYVPPHLRNRAAAGPSAPAAAPAAAPAVFGGGPRCLCHTRNEIFPGGRHMVACGNEPLVGNVRQFCAAFYHIEPTPEAGLGELCLCRLDGGAVCPRKTVACIARLQAPAAGGGGGGGEWREVHLARYVNCFRGHGTTNLHAEHFLTRDPALDAALRGLGGGGRLTLYLTYQPCHNSGGHDAATMGSGYTSCTNLLLGWHAELLSRLRVSLDVCVAYTYRAHWQHGKFPPKYAPVVEAAREGLRLLAGRDGISLRAFSPEDWAFLAGQGDGALVQAWRAAPPDAADAPAEGGWRPSASDHRAAPAVFSAAVRQARLAMDGFVAQTLKELAFAAEQTALRIAAGFDEAGRVGGPFSAEAPPPGKAFGGYRKGATGVNWVAAPAAAE